MAQCPATAHSDVEGNLSVECRETNLLVGRLVEELHAAGILPKEAVLRIIGIAPPGE